MAKGSNKGKTRWLDDEVEWGRELAGHYGVAWDDAEDWDGDDWDEEGEEIDEVAESLRAELLLRIRAVVPEGATPEVIAPGCDPNDLTATIQTAEQLFTDITNAESPAVAGFAPAVGDLENDIGNQRLKVQQRLDRKGELERELDKVQPHAGAQDPEPANLSGAKALVATQLATLPLTDAALVEAARLLALALQTAEEIAQAAGLRAAEHKRIGEEGAKVVEPGYLQDQKDRLKQGLDDLAKALLPPITDKGNEDAAKALESLQKIAEEVAEELKDLGGQAGIETLCNEAGIATDAYAALETQLGGRKATAEILKTYPAKDLGALCKQFGGAANLAALMKDFGGAAAMKAAQDSLGDLKHLKTLADAGSTGGQIRSLCDDLDGTFVAALLDGGVKPAEVVLLQSGLGLEVAAFKTLAKDSGLGGKPKALVALFTTGCEGKPDALLALAKGLDAPSLANLKGLVEDGGLGEAPDALGHLFKTGCEGKPERLVDIGTAFAGKDAREGLARMLDKGGLKGETAINGKVEIDPSCLAQLFTHISGKKPTGMADDVFAAQRATALANLVKGMDESACMALKTTVKDSALGTEPEILAQLVGTGCEGDGGKLAALSAELNKGNSKADLKNLLQKGGFGTKDDNGTVIADQAKTDCLANLFNPGSDGDPAELVKLLTALNDTGTNPNALADLQGVMTAGGLGQHPEVLGDLYKHGCLSAPDGPANGAGAKDPKVLIDMIGEFRGPTETPKFKALLGTGGMSKRDEATGQSRLASTMRFGFTARGGVQDGKQLKKLSDSFTGNLDKLDTMLTRFETAPDTVLEKFAPGSPTQPGKALQNVFNSPKHGNQASQMYGQFFQPLEAHNITSQIGTPAALMTKAEFMQNAASFECENVRQPPLPPGVANQHEVVTTVTNVDGTDIDLRMGHILCRHTRKFNDFALNGSSKTTLYPRDHDEARIQQLVAASIASGHAVVPPPPPAPPPVGVRPNHAPDPGIAQRIPPHDSFDLPGSGFRATDTDDGGTNRSRMGYAKQPPPPPNTKVKITQFYPHDGNSGGKVTIKNTDMQIIKNVLR